MSYISYIGVYYSRHYCSHPAVDGKFLLRQRVHVGMENNHSFSSCGDSEFNPPLDFTPLKYKRKRHYFSLALAAKEETEVAEHMESSWKRQFPEALKEELLV